MLMSFYMQCLPLSNGREMAFSGSVNPDQPGDSTNKDELEPKQGLNESPKQRNTWTEVGE